jgi:hypothetical protein
MRLKYISGGFMLKFKWSKKRNEMAPFWLIIAGIIVALAMIPIYFIFG